jgi:hypothetical protein
VPDVRAASALEDDYRVADALAPTGRGRRVLSWKEVVRRERPACDRLVGNVVATPNLTPERKRFAECDDWWQSL